MLAFAKAVPWKLVGILAGVFFVAFLWWRGDHYAAKSERSEALLATTIEIANNNAEISRLKERKIEKIQVILVRHEGAKAKIDEKYAADRRRIENALPEDDGHLAPVLRDWLWSLPADKSAPADPIRPRPRASDARYVGPAGQ